ncbi:MAG: glycoside hydrolase family 95 protein [Eubacterium sp.]|nr:glycoside hydrolase family 95 protein [Eubacterium sp.]
MKNTLFYTKKANYFEEALPVGNGRIGAMVYGNLKTERLSLNEDTLWSGYPKDLNTKGANAHLDDIRKAIFSGDYETAEKIANSDFHGHWCESYLPFGNLSIEFKSSVSKKGYKRTLDLSKGIAKTECKGITETVFASNPADLIVVHLEAEKEFSCDISFNSLLQNKVYTNEDTLIMEGSAPEVCQPPYYSVENPIIYGDKAMKFAGAAKILGDAVFEDGKIVVSNQKEITVLISLATSFVDFKSMPTANALERAMARFENIKPYNQLLEEHIADFSALFDRVELDLGEGNSHMPTNKRLKAVHKGATDNALVALLFQYGRYLTISASRKGTAAMNLQGIWNEHMRAPWSSNYTININTQMNYWCTDICNLSECFEPLIELVKQLAEKGTVTAKDYYNCSGFCSHHNSDIWANTNPAGDPNGKGNDSSYSIWQASAPWLLIMLYEHYQYTGDEAYKEEIKPLFKANLDFYKDFLVEHNGELVTCPSLSPENTYLSENGAHCLTYMPNMDRGILFDFFKICREFGFDTPEIEQVKPASDGRIPEWCEEFGEREIEHRHVSHLYCVYPSPFECDDALKKACEKSLYARGFGGTGWSLGWKVCLWARLRNAENANKLIKNQLRPKHPKINIFYSGGGSYPNLLDAHPPFQIDGNFGVAAGIAEMIKNNAMPKSWNGTVKGIKLKGGKEISGKIVNGKLV